MKIKAYRIPWAYLNRVPEAGTSIIFAKSPKKAEKILKAKRPNAIIGKAYLQQETK